MWQNFKQQIPVMLATVGLVVGAVAYTTHEFAARQDAALIPLRQQNDELRQQADETQRQLTATTQLLKDAVAHRGPTDLLASAADDQTSRQQQISALADDIAKRITPALPQPKSPAEIEQQQEQQVERVADRLTDNLRPVLAQQVAAEHRAETAEQRAQELSRQLAETQAAAQDALKLTHEVSAMYYDSFKDQGVLVRLMSLPANLIIDTAKGNLVGSRDRAKAEKTISAKINELDTRLHQISTVATTTRT